MAVKKKKKRKSRTRPTLTPLEMAAVRAKHNKYFIFATEYLRTADVSKAAVAIGISADADVDMWKMFKRPEVQKIIQEELNKRSDAAGITEERILNEIAAVAFAVKTDYSAWDGHDVALINSSKLSRTQASAVASSKSTQCANGGRSVEIKMHDKVKALELLAKIKGMIGTNGKGAFGAEDSRSMAERVMEYVKAQRETVPSEGEVDGNEGA